MLCWAGSLAEAKVVCDDAVAPEIFRAVKGDLAKIGGAAFMSEGLACPDKAMEECHAVYKMLDDHWMGYTDYGYSQDDHWDPSPLQREAWARVYARAVAGQPANMTFAATAGAYVRVLACWSIAMQSNALTRLECWRLACSTEDTRTRSLLAGTGTWRALCANVHQQRIW